jgi:hypothetical protein
MTAVFPLISGRSGQSGLHESGLLFGDGALLPLSRRRVLPRLRDFALDDSDERLPVIVGVVSPRVADRYVFELESVDVAGHEVPGPLRVDGSNHLQAAQDAL